MTARVGTLLLALLAAVPAAPAADVPTAPAALVERMASLGVRQSNAGLLVVRVADAATVWSLNADQPRNPASVMKILTTFAALDRLGPGYRWPLEVWADAAPGPDGAVGDLYIKGFGDPFWVPESFDRLLVELSQRGLGTVRGDLVLDSSYYALEPGDPDAFDGKGYRVYNALPHPLTLNFNAVRFLFVPDRAGRLSVRTLPELSTLLVDNRVTLERTACRRGNIDLSMRVLPMADDRTRVRFTGRFPSRCEPFELSRAVLQPDAQIAGAFLHGWRERGHEVSGGWRSGVVPEDAELVHREMSRPLGDVIRPANKFSNNVMTRQIFLTLGADAFEAPATYDKARAAVQASLAAHDLEFDELIIDNGAGLSRDARVAPSSLMALLQTAWAHRYGSDFFSSLPVPGVDGTLESRFDSGDYVGQAYVKTGTIDHVSGIAGLVQAASGARYFVVFLVNQHGIHRGAGRALQKTLLRTLVNEG